VLTYGLEGEALLLSELGIDPAGVHGIALRYAALPGTHLGDLPSRIRVPLAP
jgi:hypothetical protein